MKLLNLPGSQQFLYATMQDALRHDLQFTQLADELDVAEHFPLGQLASLLVLDVPRIAMLLDRVGAVLELELALVEQQKSECTGRIGRFKVGRFL